MSSLINYVTSDQDKLVVEAMHAANRGATLFMQPQRTRLVSSNAVEHFSASSRRWHACTLSIHPHALASAPALPNQSHLLASDGHLHRLVFSLNDSCLSLTYIDIDAPPCTHLVCGDAHYVALTSAGTVLVWGYNHLAQLGHADLSSTYTPSPCIVDALEGVSVRKVAAGGAHSAVLTDAGDIMTWGWNAHGQLGRPTFTAVDSPSMPHLVHFSLDSNHNDNDSVDYDDNLTPTIIDVACGAKHTIALDNLGRIWGCGSDLFGQLSGSPSSEIINVFKLLQLSDSEIMVRRVECGRWTTTLYYDLPSTLDVSEEETDERKCHPDKRNLFTKIT